MANENNWVKILLDKLELSTTAEFCRKADLGRGLVDKLSLNSDNTIDKAIQTMEEWFKLPLERQIESKLIMSALNFRVRNFRMPIHSYNLSAH